MGNQYDQLRSSPEAKQLLENQEAIKKVLKDYYDRHGIEYDHALFPDCESCGHCHAE